MLNRWIYDWEESLGQILGGEVGIVWKFVITILIVIEHVSANFTHYNIWQSKSDLF